MRFSLVPPQDNTDNVASPEEEMIEAAKNDEAAFNTLYKCYVLQMYRYLRSTTPNDDDAADLTQQVFLKVFKALPRYTRQPGVSFKAWIFCIGRNAAISAARSRRRTTISLEYIPEAQFAELADGPESTFLRREKSSHRWEIVARLKEEERELLRLRFAAGLTSREIATIVGGTEAAVTKRFSRLMEQLRTTEKETLA